MIEKIKKYLILSLFALLFASQTIVAQTIQGVVTDGNNNPVPYASVYIKEARLGTTTNQDGRFAVKLTEGKYNVTFRCLGFETIDKKITIKKGVNRLNITMMVKPFQIDPVTIGPGKEDIAYNTMRHAISMAPYYRNQVKEFRAEVYIKGTVKVKKISRVVRNLLKKEMDPPKAGNVYMQESVNNIHYTAPDKYEQRVKMIRSNLPFIEGTDVMGYINANFYSPMIGDIILPLSPQAFKHYNFKNVGYSMHGGRAVDKIKVTPKRKSKQLVEGYVYIADEYWNLHEVDLWLNTVAGSIRVKQTFGEVEPDMWIPVSHYFEVKAKFLGNEADGWYVSSVKYNDVKRNKQIKTPGNLIAANKRREDLANGNSLSASEVTESKPKKKTKGKKLTKAEKEAIKLEELIKKENPSTREMYQMVELMNRQAHRTDTLKGKAAREDKPGYYRTSMDSAARKIDPVKWDEVRPVVLSDDESKVDKQIKALVDTTKGKNNIQFRRNPVSVVFTGIHWSNQASDLRITYSGLLSLDQIDFNTVDGLALNAMFRIGKYYDKTAITFYTSVGYGFSSKQPRLNTSLYVDYAPKYRGNVQLSGKYYNLDFNNRSGINRQINTLTTLMMGDNFMKLYKDIEIKLTNSIAPVIGLDFFTEIGMYRREPQKNNTDFIFIPKLRKNYTPNVPVNPLADSTHFGAQDIVYGDVTIVYTPFQRFRYSGEWIRYTRSDYPTFRGKLRFGIPTALNRDAKFLNWEIQMNQRIRVGALSEFNYRLTYGDFAQTQNMHFADFKHFNTQKAYLSLSDFGNSFQTLDFYKFSTNSYYVQLFANYKSPFLLLKLIPGISETMWLENLHLSALFTHNLRPYYEFGYSVNRIVALLGVGVFVGFQEDQFNSVMLKVSLDL